MSVEGGDRLLFEVRDLAVDLQTRGRCTRVVDGVHLGVRPRQTLGIVGSSGVGKTVSMLAALQLLPQGRVVRGEALLDGVDLLRCSSRELRRIRGRDIGVVFQDPVSSLHPSFRVGDQIAEAIRLHQPDVSRRDARAKAVELLDLVRVPAAPRRAREYPHEWSGGMRQRAMIAMAVANGPKLLIADEPTTALDVTIQAQVLEVLRDVQREFGTSLVVITHDIGVVAELADTVAVLEDGRVVETGTVADVLASPRLPYRAALAARSPVRRPILPTADAVLEVSELIKHFPSRRRGGPAVQAVDGVTFTLHAGESLGLVGESGCGKSTLARTVVRLLEPTSGRIRFEGRDITDLVGEELRAVHARLRIVFQDAYGSLNPRRTVGESVAEPLRIHGRRRPPPAARARELFELVGLDPDLASRYPHQLSGGQRQRVGIARALALDPRVLVLDEPVSSLDLPVQIQILELLERLQHELGLAYLFVSHDLRVVRRLCHRVAVMYLGRLVEIGDAESVYGDPSHPYTKALLSAIPPTSPRHRDTARRMLLSGDPPDPADPPSGCRFHTRCPVSFERCGHDEPRLSTRDGRASACHLVASDVSAGGFSDLPLVGES